MFLFNITRTFFVIILWCVVEKSYGVATVKLNGEDPCFPGASCSLTCVATDGTLKTDGFIFSQNGAAVITCQNKNTCNSLVPSRYSYITGNDTHSKLTISNFDESTRGGQWCCHDGTNGNPNCSVVIENSVPSNLTFSPVTCNGTAPLTVSCALGNLGRPNATLILSNSSTTLARQTTSPLNHNLDSSDSVTCSYQWDAFPNYALGTNTSVTTECKITSTVTISLEDGTVRFPGTGEISSFHMIVKGSPLPNVIIDGGASFSEQAVNATAKAVTVSAAAQPGSIRKVVVTATNSEGSSSVTLLVCTDPCLYVNALAFVIVLGCLQVASILSCIPHFKPVLVRDLYKMVQVRDALTGSTIICDVVFVIVVGSVNLNLQSCLECLYNSDVHLHNSSIAFVIIGSTGCVSKVVIICYSMKRRNRSPEIAASDSGSKKDVNLVEVNSSESKRSDEDQEKGNGDVGQKSPKAGSETKPRPLYPQL